MITENDVYFHPPTSDHYTWAETNYFGFYIPEENIHVGAYVQAKPNLGAVLSSVTIFDGISNTPHEVLYSDCHMHLPMPEGNLDDFKLENGLAITCTKAVMDYHLRFDDKNGVSFDVKYKALMEPYDIHDPKMDPLADQVHEDDVISNAAYAGHWDQSGHITGTAMTSNPWLAWPLMFLSHSFCRWDKGGIKGWGEVQDLCKEDFNAKL